MDNRTKKGQRWKQYYEGYDSKIYNKIMTKAKYKQGCIIYPVIDYYGYARISYKNKYIRIARWLWEQSYGKIKNNLFVCHICDNPACINLKHFFLGTQKDNMLDKQNKGRQTKGESISNSVLTEDIVRKARRLKEDGLFLRQIAKRLKINESTLCMAINRRTWKHIV